MDWPPRVLLPDDARAALGAVAGARDTSQFADAQVQQQARRQVCSESPGFRTAIRMAAQALDAEGAVVIEAAPIQDGALVILASAAGTVTADGNGDPEQLVWDVRPAAHGSGAVRSRSAAAFSLHTDSAHQDRPHDVVVLACVEPTRDGSGLSLVAPAARTAEALALQGRDQDLGLLGDLCFPFASPSDSGLPVGYFPILQEGSVRYREPLVRWGMQLADPPLDEAHRCALKALQQVIDQPSLPTAFALVAGDVLFLDNHRMLHGRTEIGAAGNRHLKRLKVYAPGDPSRS